MSRAGSENESRHLVSAGPVARKRKKGMREMTNAGLFTTDGAAVPLEGVEVTGEVLGAHARVKVRQRYRNLEQKPVEAVYTFPLPTEATLVGFAMICEGRRLEGVVQEREQAFRTYDDALWAGHGAALLEQERPNVFTAQVGNLLPGEETIVEIEYLERMQADEGALRWSIPTLVAPRYVPGTPTGNRTGHGAAEPTDRVPDADRITPKAGQVAYGLTLDLVFDLGRSVAVESPSHALTVHKEGERTRVTFAQKEVALDRDVVVTARGLAEGPFATVLSHRPADGPGFFSLTVVPDLSGAESGRAPKQDVVFLIDISGSMEGASLPEAKAALRLCLRHLREGDRFNVIAFESSFHTFAKESVLFTQRTLEQADAWVNGLEATGGTELLQPMLAAMKLAHDGVVVLLTDGQVGNEQEILTQVLGVRKSARVYSFGIGTNVSDVLLRDLARRTGGAVEFIHPGERIDEKVVAQFARAIAARVTDVQVKLSGVDVGELAPSELPALVDGEPWVVFGRIESGGHGEAVLTGKLDGRPFRAAVPLDLATSSSRPAIAKLWAAERIRELSAATVVGRREERMRERIIELAVAHGVSSAHTSFIVVETRTGDRRATGQPETRPIPVNLPAGWAMFKKQEPQEQRARSAAYRAMPAMSMSMDLGAPPAQAFGGSAPTSPPKMPPPAPASPGHARQAKKSGGIGQLVAKTLSTLVAGYGGGSHDDDAEGATSAPLYASDCAPREEKAEGGDPIVALLSRQLASGLWDDPQAAGGSDAQRVRATAHALLELYDAGVTTTHALHAAQVKKAVAALIQLAVTVAASEPGAAELGLGVAWLIASGRRTRTEIESAVGQTAPLAALKARLGDERALRAHLGSLG